MAIEFTVLANKSNAPANTTGKAGKAVVSGAKGAAPTVTLEYLIDGVKNGSKEPAFPRQLGDAILNGIAGKEGRPARMNGQDVSQVEVDAYLALPAVVRGAIKYESAVPAVASMSALIVSGHIHNALLEVAEKAEILENYEGGLLTKNERDGQLQEIGFKAVADEADGGETDELTADDFLR